MSDDKPPFDSPQKLAEWLANGTTGFGMMQSDAKAAAKILQPKGYDDTGAFHTLTHAILTAEGLSNPLAGKVLYKWEVWKESNVAPDPPDALLQRSGKKRVFYFEDINLSDSWKRVKFCECINKGVVRPGAVEEKAEEAEATEKIEFSNDLFGDEKAGKVLYVRDCYKGLFAEIEKERSDKLIGGAVITGTPGIGKTMFSAYLIRQYMDMDVNTILFKFRNEGYIIISRTKKWECDGYSYELIATLPEGQEFYVGGLALDHQLPKYLKNLKDVIYIVDLNQEKFQESLPTAFTIILTSPNKEKYASAVSSGTRTVAVLWMPVWSLEELQQHDVPIENLEARYEVHGGILRYLLWREADAKRDLKAVLDSSGSNEFTLALDKDCKDANISGRLVHYQLQNLDDYHSSKAVFASKQIRDRVANRFYSGHDRQDEV